MNDNLRHFPEHDPPGLTEKARQRAELERQTAEFLARGNQITQCAPDDSLAGKLPVHHTQQEMRKLRKRTYRYTSRQVLRQ